MPERHESFTPTCPANTDINTPVEVALTIRPAEVSLVTVTIPSGHASKTGIAVALGHTVVIPRTTGGWIIGNAQAFPFEVHGMPNSGAWSVFMFNLDKFDHYWTVDIYGDEVIAKMTARPPTHILTPPLPLLDPVTLGSRLPPDPTLPDRGEPGDPWLPGAAPVVSPGGYP